MSRPTLLATGKTALDYIKKAVDIANETVKVTLGPDANLTLMYRTFNRGPRLVDDGFWTLEAQTPKNPFVRLAFETFKETVAKTNKKVGDGTSTTCLIAAKLFNELYIKISESLSGFGNSSSSGIKLKKQILQEADKVKEQIRAASKEVKDLETLDKVAAISLGDTNDISKAVAKMAFEVGVDGFIDVVEGYKGELEYELAKGMRFPAKVVDKAFVNKPERYEMVIEDSPVLITNYKIDDPNVLRYLTEQVFQEIKYTILAPDFSKQAIVAMALSTKNGIFIQPVKVPSLRTEVLEDIATFCGATVVDKNKGHKLQTTKKDALGYFEKLTVKDAETKEDAILLGGKGTKSQSYTTIERKRNAKGEDEDFANQYESSPIKERIKTLRSQLVETQDDGFKRLMEKRIASMASAGGIIRVGAPTDAESLPLKLKVEDVVFACKAALKSGYVKGGGLCLKEIADQMEDGHVLKNALLQPYKQIQENAGGELEIGEDVIDPTDAVYYAVEHATSVVANLITTKNLIPEADEIENGEGELELAKAARELLFAWRKQHGLISEGEQQAISDGMMGKTESEYDYLNRD